MTGAPTPLRPFDPAQRLSRVNGAAYLEVGQRLAWFRDRYPDGQIVTELLDHGPDWAIFKATVTAMQEGGVVCGRATGHGSESAGDFRDYLEKAETKAIGRALAALGFGTQFVVNHEGRRDAAATPPRRGHGARDQAATTERAAPGAPPSPAQPARQEQTMTQRQKNYLEAVARAAGLDAGALDALAHERHGGPYRWLSREDASALITELEQRPA